MGAKSCLSANEIFLTLGNFLSGKIHALLLPYQWWKF